MRWLTYPYSAPSTYKYLGDPKELGSKVNYKNASKYIPLMWKFFGNSKEVNNDMKLQLYLKWVI